MFCDVENDTLIFHLMLVCRNTVDFYILTLFSVTLIIISSDNFLIDPFRIIAEPQFGRLL